MSIFYGLLSDPHNDTLSSKRLMSFISFVLLCVAFVCNLVWKLEVKEFMFETLSYITMAGFGATVVEKFSTSKHPPSNQ